MDYRSRSRYVWRDGELIEIDLDKAREIRRARRASANVLGDIPEPFTSPVDGSVITSRADLREHNKRLGVIDIGDEKKPPTHERTALPPIEDVMRDRKEFLESLSVSERQNYMNEIMQPGPEDQQFREAGQRYLRHLEQNR